MKAFSAIQLIRSLPLLCAPVCFVSLMLSSHVAEKGVGLELSKGFSDGTMASFAISVPSFTYGAFVFSFSYVSASFGAPISDKASLNAFEMLTFLVGSSLTALLYFMPASCHSLRSIENASALMQTFSLSQYLRRTALLNERVIDIILLFFCASSLTSSITHCYGSAGAMLESWVYYSFPPSLLGLIPCAGLIYLMMIDIKKLVSKALTATSPFYTKNLGLEELLLNLNSWNKTVVPALYVLIMLIIIVVYSIRLFELRSYASYGLFLWVNFAITATVLTIDIIVMKNEIFCASLNLEKEKVLSVKKSYLRYISHEIRTPVNALSIGVHMLVDEMKRTKLVDKDKMELLGCMESACTVTVDMLNDILTMDKIGTKTMEIRKQSVEAASFVCETLKMFVPSAREKNIELSISRAITKEGTRCLESSDYIDIDVFKMQQVLRNVVSNGLKFTANGGRVEVSMCVAEDTLQIDVVDTGAGMDSESRDKIFKSAFQYKPELLQGGGGSGFGLLISKEIVDMHQGSITLYSAGEGKGCTMSIQLPLSAPCPPSSDVVQSVPSMPAVSSNLSLTRPESQIDPVQLLSNELGSQEPVIDQQLLKFLVADDSPSCRKMTVRAIRSFARGLEVDVEVCEANDGVEAVLAVAVANASGSPFDVVFMDGNMPNIDGPTATHQIRSGGCNRPIIGVTGNAHEFEVAEFIKSGASQVWTKPIDMSQLKAAIKEAADAKPSPIQEPAIQENREITELKAKLAMKRAALQLASVDMIELRATYENEKQSVLLLTERNLAMTKTLSSIRLQSAAESADHDIIIALKDEDIARLVHESEQAAEAAIERHAVITQLTKSLNETEREKALIDAVANSRKSARGLMVVCTDTKTVLECAELNAHEARLMCESTAKRALLESDDGFRVALSPRENKLKNALELAEIGASALAIANEEACRVAFALSARNAADAWALSELNAQIALKLSDDCLTSALLLSEKDRGEAYEISELNTQTALKMSEDATRVALCLSEDEKRAALLRAATDAKVVSASNSIDRKLAFALSARNTAAAWSLSQLNAQIAMQASEDATQAALTLSETEKRLALDLASAHALVASAASDADREAALALSAMNTERAWSLSELNARTALAASVNATKRALSFNEKEKDAAFQLAASHAQVASVANAFDRDAAFALSARKAAHARSLAELKTQAALKLAEDATKDAMQRSERMSKDALYLATCQAQIVRAANEADRVAAFALSARNTAAAWSLSELNTQTALKMSEDATRVALCLSEDEKGAALLLAATDAQVAIAANEADREEAFALSARNTATAWLRAWLSLSELNTQTALKISEDATRVALCLSEDEKGAALLLAATDAQVAIAANEADRDEAFALSARNTATALSLSELNTQTALNVSQFAMRRVLSLNERDKKVAKQLAEDDALSASVAVGVDRDAAIALHEDKMAIALKLSESSKNIFIARLMHEIRTPLHIISAQLSIADEESGPTGQDLTVLRRQSAILQNAIENFEFAASIDKMLSQKKLSLQQVDVKTFIRGEIAEASYLSLVGPVHVVIIVEAEVPNMIVTDHDLLRRSLRPLLSNCIEHRLPGSEVEVRISFAAETKVTRVTLSNLSTTELKLPELFSMWGTVNVHHEPQDRLQLSSTKGLGLGLYTADKTLRALNSSLEFSCVPALTVPESFCVVFSFDLCCTSMSEIVLERIGDDRPEPLLSTLEKAALRTILVVDDSPICRKLLIKILKDAGFNCDSANDGEEAVAMISTKQFAAVFMDLRMPVKDGLQATREVRALGIITPIIALSAESSQEAKDEAQVAGVSAFVVKPVRAEKILAELLKLLHVNPAPNELQFIGL